MINIHQHPELGNREFRTAELITKYLQSLGIETSTKVGFTGVLGILKAENKTVQQPVFNAQ